MKKTVLTVAVICLVAVLLCGAACWSTAAYVRRTAGAAAEDASAAARLPEPTSYAPTLLAGRSGGETLSASEIYELSCRQVVGISTTVTGYNMFGQLTANAVSGTGFIISEDGYILTNNHVVEDAKSTGADITVKLYDGSEYTAKLVGVEGRDSDIAVLKIEASGLSPVTFGNSDEMKVGENIYVVGNPLGELTYTMTAGIISALDREIAAERNVNINMFQLDAAVNSGNSGGPVYDEQGRVLGIVTAKYQSTGVEGLGFAIPINDAADIAEQLISTGYVTGKAYLGIMVTNMTEADAERFGSTAGVCVTSVTEGSCAEKAGLQQGDVIVELGGKAVATITELNTAKKDYKAGDSCELKIWRGGKYLTLTVVFDEEPAQPESAAETPNGGSAQPGQDRRDPGSQDGGSGSWGDWGDWGSRGGDSEDDGESGGYSSFEEWMNDLFGRFYEYFGGDSEDSGEESGSSSEGGFRHFGS